ncbi:PTS sugar transporter subunit IIA [Virgibacillus sp. DJP39]|uniref:PTS sugar transporter subunit IIA n=1 Tax=Virgibacillus sp. DJP39 TaxID=3409790 RepID=UPI003BB7E21D
MLIGGWLSRQGDSLDEKVKAIVVCPKGVSVSRLMLSELRELFPEFIFLDSLSVREFQQYEFDYDIVFSPIFLETDKKLFIANSFLEREEKYQLKKQVMLELHGYIPFDINVEDLIGIVKKYAVIENESSLSKELQQYISQDDARFEKHKQHEVPAVNLSELITPNKITLKKSVFSWEEAIRMSAYPLVKSGHIETDYVNAMIHHCQKDPYIVIAPNTAIPHAAPEDGVNDVSMSLLKLDEGIKFAEEYEINIIIVIAAVDKNKHLRALMQLMQLVGSEEGRRTIIGATTSEEIYSVIKNYSV